MKPKLRCVQTILAFVLLLTCVAPNAGAQTWASTATKAYPVQFLQNATLVGPLAASTSIHVVVGLQTQNANQIQPTLLAMLTPGNPLYGTSLTLQQFVTQFGATSAQVQAVENYLTSMGFTNITIADNQLLIDAYATSAQVESAFNTSLVGIFGERNSGVSEHFGCTGSRFPLGGRDCCARTQQPFIAAS